MNQEWEKFGKDIRNIVEDAVNSQDFRQLNKAITNTVNEAVSSIQQGLRSAGEAVNKASFLSYADNKEQKKWEQKPPKSQPGSLKAPGQTTNPELFKKNTSVKAGGLVLAVCGYTFSIGTGVAVATLFLVGMLLGNFHIGMKIALSILIPLLVGSGIMAWKGSSLLSALKRYHGYIGQLHGRTYCNIKELADRSGKSFHFVLKDVRKMIANGWFCQGHLDHENSCLIVSNSTYQEYQEIQMQRMAQKELEQKQRQGGIQRDGEGSKVQEVVTKGQEYISKMQACSQAIPEQEIVYKIAHMELLVKKILERVKEDPDSLEDIQKLMEYYLPTTVKLLEAYQQLGRQPVQGENIKNSKAEIEKALDTLNVAFEKLLDSLFEDVAWDVSSDISVLHTMLAQEGLAKDDFKYE